MLRRVPLNFINIELFYSSGGDSSGKNFINIELFYGSGGDSSGKKISCYFYVMKIQSLYFIVCLLFSYGKVISQGMNKYMIIDSSRHYYQSHKIFSLIVYTKSKSSISEDTTYSTLKCFINKPEKEALFLLKEKGIFVSAENEYSLLMNKPEFSKIKDKEKKYYAYNQVYQKYPFVDFETFLEKNNLENLFFTSNDSDYILSDMGTAYFLNKNDYYVRKIVTKKIDFATKGIFYSEIEFTACNEIESNELAEINYVKSIIGSDKNLVSVKDRDIVQPKQFHLSELNDPKIRILNADNISFENKIIFMDFFYEGCMPCVKSYPTVIELFENSGSDLLVIGVDHKLSDTAHIEKYLQRFNIKYPVIVGEIALKISQSLFINTWPTFVLVAPNGDILEYNVGHSESFLRNIKKKYLKR